MIDEFHQLTRKIEQIVGLVQTLREENVDLQRQLAQLTATNAQLTERIQQAHERVSAVLSHSAFNEPASNEPAALPITAESYTAQEIE
ncbi:MAG: hypothetical protein K0R08_427 [Solimicrobium sp.]|jgi:uncharacterized protein (TIGR02449 family)|nr:hypothetical protein [Solimicrobium sp.]